MKTATLPLVWCLFATIVVLADDEPPALNPFGPKPRQRDDALPGCVELSNGSVSTGLLYLTADTRLRIYDEQLQRQREVPLRVVRRIECKVDKEWMEKEWRFKENANDEKVFTGRAYPARQYHYEITLHDERTLKGTMSGILYMASSTDPEAKPQRFLLHKRDKGPVGSRLDALVYLKKVEFGEAAMQRGQRRATQQSQALERP